jgi:hypothetical protein
MIVTLYIPNKIPQVLSPNNFPPLDATGLAQIPDLVSKEFGCEPNLIDVLDTGPGYVAYSICDCEGELNQSAMQALMAISRYPYDPEDIDQQLRGPILIISQG